MLIIIRRNLTAHPRRYVATVGAVAVGIAFLFAVLVEVATFSRSFDDTMRSSVAGIDASIRSANSISTNEETYRGHVPADLAEIARAVDGVRIAEPAYSRPAMIVGSDGDTIGGSGPPQLGFEWRDDPDLNPFRIAEGRAPQGLDEVVIDRASARQGDLSVGDTIEVLVPKRLRLRLVGIAAYGTAESAGPMTATLLSPDAAAEYLADPGTAASISVVALDGISQSELVERLRTALDESAAAGSLEVVTGQELQDEAAKVSETFSTIVSAVLLTFASIALVVAAFGIYNTFAILVAQRTRESALLRALGASRRQLSGWTLGESFAVGVLGSAVGLGFGLLLARMLSWLIGRVGFFSLGDHLVVSASSVIIGAGVGIVSTVIAAIAPARRGSRIAPVEAMRSAAIDGGSVGRRRTILGAALMAAGVGLAVQAALSANSGASTRAGVGAAITLLSVVVIGPALAPAVVRVIGAPIARTRGTAGLLAQRNAVRHPRRTASTVTALVIGVAVVTLFTVVAASLNRAVTRSVDEQMAGDVIVQPTSFSGSGLDDALVDEVASSDGVDSSLPLSFMPVTVGGETAFVTATDMAAGAAMFDLGVIDGSVAGATGDVIAVSATWASDHDVAVGDALPTRFLDGVELQLRVVALYDNTAFAGDYVMPADTAGSHSPGVSTSLVVLRASEGVSAIELDRRIDMLISDAPGVESLDREDYAETIGRRIDTMLALVYGLLALSIGIALLGIATTISLATMERVREIGLMRALGQTRRQVRTTVRLEAIMIATFGTIIGLAVGMFAAWAVLTSSSDELLRTVSFPVSRLVMILFLGALAGIAAARRPARRVARLDVLEAIAAP